MRFFVVILLILAIINGKSSNIENQKKINKVNLLLPLIYEHLDSRIIQYELKAFNGCYKWKSSQPQILSIEEIPDKDNSNCFSNALIKLASNQPYSNIIWITATDQETGDVLKVESKIANVHEIRIMTKLRTIEVDDIQVLELIGMDKEGNVFSSLEGMRFEWQIDNQNVLEQVSLKNSLIKTTELRKKLENSNFQTDLAVVKGLKTGQVDVTVRINEKKYQDIKTSVKLFVIEHFLIYPDKPLFLIPGSIVKHQLSILKSSNNQQKLEGNNINTSIVKIYLI